MSDVPAASGRQHEVRHGDHVVTVVEVSGGVRAYTVGGADVLDGYGAGEMCVGARGQTLAPWPNRIADGAYTFEGESYQLPLTEPERRTAIHGLVRWANWIPEEEGDSRLTMSYRLHPSPGYPFTLDLRVHYELDDDGLTVRTVATNAGSRPCPYGLGFHPYLTVGTPRVDEARLRLPGRTRMPTDDRGIPVGREPVGGTPYDFLQPRLIGDLEIDYAFADLDRDGDGRAEVTLSTPDEARSVTIWLDEAFRYVEIFTGDTLPEDRRRRGLGVEPMTCPPNAFPSGEDVLHLAPGESATATWGVRPRGF